MATNDARWTAIPEVGHTADQVLADLAATKAHDRDWRSGKVFSLVYSAGDPIHELHAEALRLFSAENGLNVMAFPSIGVLSRDLVGFAVDLLGGGVPTVNGYLTSGGTESLLQTRKVARDVGRERGIARPKVIAARSAHAAFTKAAELFDLELVRVGVTAGFTLDLDQMAEAIDERTIMLVGSAPTYPHGVIDPLEAIGAMALEHDLLFHVDACLGGFLLPWLTELGHVTTPFTFAIDGVTSMSADLHKYGYASKGVSVILYRDKTLARHQVFLTEDWMGGLYGSTVLAGTRPAGPIAAAWATVMRLGRQGYLELAETTWQAARRLIAGVGEIPGLMVLGEPDMTVLAIGATAVAGINVFGVADELSRSGGWYLDRQSDPDALHLTVHAGSAPSVEPFLADLTVATARVTGKGEGDRSVPYATDQL